MKASNVVLQALLAAALLLPAAADLRAEDAHIDRIDIVDPGLYSSTASSKVADAAQPGGTCNQVADFRLEEKTTTIPAAVGTRFGFRYDIVGAPKLTPITLRIVIDFPPPGLTDPKTGTKLSRAEYNSGAFLGAYGFAEYALEQDWEVAPGVWTFEIWDKDRKLAEQSFTLKNP